MNTIKLKGIIRSIDDSHNIQDIEFGRATLITKRDNGKEDALNLRFKKYSNPYSNDQEVTLSGNLRSYSSKSDDGKNKVELYVFTYFDHPELNENDQEDTNYLEMDGRICKIEPLRKTQDGKTNIHLILANNLIVSDGKKRLNSYIPCIAWGKTAVELSKCSVNTKLMITGELHSREYKKNLGDGTFEFRVAHECVIKSFEVL
jgi:hypothetical protein